MQRNICCEPERSCRVVSSVCWDWTRTRGYIESEIPNYNKMINNLWVRVNLTNPNSMSVTHGLDLGNCFIDLTLTPGELIMVRLGEWLMIIKKADWYINTLSDSYRWCCFTWRCCGFISRRNLCEDRNNLIKQEQNVFYSHILS